MSVAQRLAAAARVCVDLAVRGLAAFALVNLILGLKARPLDSNWTWIDLSALPRAAAWLLLAVFVAGVLGYGWLGRRGRRIARLVAALLGLGCLLDAAAYYGLVVSGRIVTDLPLPLSLPLAGLLWAWAAWPLDRPGRPLPAWQRAARVAAGGAVATLWLLAQLLAFGATDYRRPADAIVVFGAAVRPSGRPSLALHDRTRTGCVLYHQGFAPKLVMSGGRNPAVPLSEPAAMRALALTMGVPDEDILLDETGLNTRATVAAAARLARRHGWSRLLMVSHDYHLSRIKLLSHRTGLTVYTVPAEESRPLRWKPYYVVRELAAWVYHYLRPALVERADRPAALDRALSPEACLAFRGRAATMHRPEGPPAA